MKTVKTSTNNAVLTLAFPLAFRQYLLRRQNQSFAFTFLLLFPLSLYVCVYHKNHWNFIDYISNFVPVTFLALRWQRENFYEDIKLCNYKIGPRSFELFALSLNGWQLNRRKLELGENKILEVRQTRWQNLPALQVVVKIGKFKLRRTLWMVYEEGDSERVQNEVLPLLKLYGAELTLTEEKKPYYSN